MTRSQRLVYLVGLVTVLNFTRPVLRAVELVTVAKLNEYERKLREKSQKDRLKAV